MIFGILFGINPKALSVLCNKIAVDVSVSQIGNYGVDEHPRLVLYADFQRDSVRIVYYAGNLEIGHSP